MRFAPGTLVYGVTPWILIDCAHQLHDRQWFTFDDICEALGAPRWETESVLAALLRDSFLLRTVEEDTHFSPTAKFHQLANAKIGAGITRAQAEDLLAAVLRKAQEINDAPRVHRCRVQCIVVFGSYLTDAPLLGDLDLGVEVKEILGRTFDEAREEAETLMSRRVTRYARTFRLLRLRKPKLISLHKLDEVLELGTPYRVVFGDLQAKP